MARKTALILSGGGAKGAFQCAAEKYAREVKGYHWDIIAGVSVGALNGTMLAMQKYGRLYEVWNTISNEQVYTGGFNLWAGLKVLLGARSFYGNDPLWKLLQAEFEPDKIAADLRIGAVSLVTGEYCQFTRGDPALARAVLASTVMPIIWTPVDVSPEFPSMVDGGVRNISPIGDVLAAEPDEILIINCSSEAADPLPAPPGSLPKIGLRTLDILLNELFVSDMREFMRINGLVQEAAAQGIVLHNPSDGKPFKYYDCKIIEPSEHLGSDGKPFKYYDCKIIEPSEHLGDTLDFSQPTVQRSLRLGWERAKEVLGE